MHRFFDIPELVILISKKLERNTDRYHFGATCRGLWSTVQGEVWRVVDERMVHCLVPQIEAAQAWETVSVSLSGLCGRMKRAELTASSEPSDDLAYDLANLAYGDNYFQDAMLFLCRGLEHPSLRFLALCLPTTHSAHVVKSLFQCLPQAIEFLKITLQDSAIYGKQFLIDFVLSLGNLQLQLHNLHIIGQCNEEEDGRHPVDLCSNLDVAYATVFQLNVALRTEMRTLTLFAINDGRRLLPVLSAFPKLSSVHLKFISDEKIAPYSFSNSSFPNLEVVHFDSGWWIDLNHPHHISFFQSLSSPAIKHLDIIVRSIQECQEVLTLVVSRWASTLQVVVVTIQSESQYEHIAPLSTILQPVYAVRQLISLCLYHDSCFFLDIDDIRSVVLACPHLETLGLGLSCFDNQRTLVSPRVLSVIVQGLRKLKALEISVDFDLDTGWTAGRAQGLLLQ